MSALLIDAGDAHAQNRLTLKGSEVRLVGGTWYHYTGGQQGDLALLDRIIVRLQNGATPTQSAVDHVVGSSGVDLIESPLPGNYFVLSVDTTAHNPLVVAADLSAHSSVEEVIFNGQGSVMGASPGGVAGSVDPVADVLAGPATGNRGNPCTSGFIPSDPLWDSGGIDVDGDGIGDGQWNLCEIRMPEAWGVTTGEPEVVVGIIDSPADYNHVDLVGGLWTNPFEANGQSGVDDGDANDCIDDLNGWDFGNVGAFNGCPGDADPSNIGDPDFDGEDHGTASAGVALARTNNAVGGSFEGMAGIAGGNGDPGTGAEYMVIAQYYRSGMPGDLRTDAESIARGIQYAAETGADVISITSGFMTNYNFFPLAVNLAETLGVVVVASGGNVRGSYERLYYPAAYPTVLAVGATLFTDERWPGSSVGDSEPSGNGDDESFVLDVTAPGGERSIISTDPTGDSGTNSGDYLTSSSELYAGTSASAPHVVGVAALVRSINPSLTALQVREILRLTADPDECVEVDPDYDEGQECGYGRVDAYEALKATLERFGGSPQADLLIPAGETWDFGDVEVAFAPGARLTVEGTLNASGTTFDADDTSQGWEGLRVELDGEANLSAGSVLRDVQSYGGAAVYVYGDFTLDNSDIIGSPLGLTASGIFASGASAFVRVKNESEIFDHEGDGVYATSGAYVYIEDSFVRDNADGGVKATLADVLLYDSVVRDNAGGYGAEAVYYGSVSFGFFSGPYPAPPQNNDLADNAAGTLLANYRADIAAGNNGRFEQNNFLRTGSELHAKARTDSDVRARCNYWGSASGPNLAFVDTDASSTYTYQPFLTAPGGICDLAQSSRGSSPAGGSSLAGGTPLIELEGPEQVPAMVWEALGLADTGQTEAAFLLLMSAVETAATPEAAARAYAALTRLARRGPSEGLAGFLHERSQDESERPWALSALVEVQRAEGETEGAGVSASALTAEYAGTEHALFGWAARHREAVETGDVAAATAALDAAVAAWPEHEATAMMQREHTVWLGTGDGGGRGAVTDGTSSPWARAGSARAETALYPAYPNPSSGRVTLPLVLGEDAEARVEVFDVLGRRVALLHDGPLAAGRHALALDGAVLPAGVYVVRATVGGPGEARQLTRRVSLVR
ncbi:MAG: S8 family serine peptidase [Bacteroidota bacterium]